MNEPNANLAECAECKHQNCSGINLHNLGFRTVVCPIKKENYDRNMAAKKMNYNKKLKDMKKLANIESWLALCVMIILILIGYYIIKHFK